MNSQGIPNNNLDFVDELTFVEDNTHINPPAGSVKIYAKTDGEIYKLDSAGNETGLGGGGGVSTTNAPVLNNALVFYDGTDGTKIKQINGILYDSLNSALQVAKIKSASHNVELEFENTNAILTADGDIKLNANSLTLTCPSANLTYNAENVRFLVEDAKNNLSGGINAGDAVTTGQDNTALGKSALTLNTVGNYNTAIGTESLLQTLGNENTAVGWFSGGDSTTGIRNTFVGKASGANNGGGEFNTYIGCESKGVIGQVFNNSTAIGHQCQITASNQIVLGNASITEIRSSSDGLCDLGSSTKKFKDLYITGSITGSSLPVVTRFRCSPALDRNPTDGNAVYDDDYIRLGWDGGGQNDVQIRRKAGTDAYISYCSKPNTLTVAQIGVNNEEQTYELNGSISMVGGEIFYINLSPVNVNTAPAYRISVHFTENVVGTDGNLDWIVERFDKCSLV